MTFLANLEKKSKLLKILLGFALIGATGTLDFLTGYEFSFSLFYVIPISFITWLIGRRPGILASLVSAFVWLWADVASGHYYMHALLPLWNTLIRLSFFIIITLLLSALKNALEREKEMARTNYLTGAVNSRLFFKLVQTENVGKWRKKNSMISLATNKLIKVILSMHRPQLNKMFPSYSGGLAC